MFAKFARLLQRQPIQRSPFRILCVDELENRTVMAGLESYVPNSASYYYPSGQAGFPDFYFNASVAIKYLQQEAKLAHKGILEARADVREETNDLLQLAKQYKVENNKELRQARKDRDTAEVLEKQQTARDIAEWEKQVRAESSSIQTELSNEDREFARESRAVQQGAKANAANWSYEKYMEISDPDKNGTAFDMENSGKLDDTMTDAMTAAVNAKDRLQQLGGGSILTGGITVDSTHNDGRQTTSDLVVKLNVTNNQLKGSLGTPIGSHLNSFLVPVYQDDQVTFLRMDSVKCLKLEIQATVDPNAAPDAFNVNGSITLTRAPAGSATTPSTGTYVIMGRFDGKKLTGILLFNGQQAGTFSFGDG